MLEKAYDPQAVEDRIYEMWEQSGAFTADASSAKEPFTISLPPPNATGNLHLGHAVMLAIQDILIRYARMNGKEALWLPGTDHAAIATENVVIKKLREEGMRDPRKELGREELVRRIAAFVQESRGTIRGQVRKMGASCDWSRERYTMDPMLNRCVNEVFKKMYDDGVIYRGHRIVNWDPKLQTTVSDDEIVWVEETSPFYTFQYGPFQIGTVRPETKFGDKYVVMHPDDERYAKYQHGQQLELEWINGPIRATVIKDKAVDPAFGTGVMTITPWHTEVDFDIAERHGLEKEQIIDFQGRLLPIAEEFAGMRIDEARPKIVEKLQAKGLLVTVDGNYVHRKATSQRGGGTIEPQIKLQWFVDVNKRVIQWKGQQMTLKEVMHDVVHHGDIQIIPDRFTKTYFHWIDNLRDWCVSRQIWWGHRVPVFYCGKCVEAKGESEGNKELRIKNKGAVVSVRPVEKCPVCGAAVEQDADTLDTWFSSGLWTWSTLADPSLADRLDLRLEEILEQSPDFQKFHPTSVLETGYDIIFFWVARMILMTTYATGQVPFKTVYLHGLVRTRDGKKMSKSDPKTMIDPLDMIQKYGADALRLSMIVGQSPGNDGKLYEEKIAGYRNFVNKLWNASRFVLLKCEEAKVDPHAAVAAYEEEADLSLVDQALVCALDRLVADVTKGLAEYRLSDVGDRLYAFVWDFFCDWYLELSKGQANHALLVQALRTILQLLHPYCPFVTEELWASLKHQSAGPLLTMPWPGINETPVAFVQAHERLQLVIGVITSIRKIRADYAIDAGAKLSVAIHAPEHAALLESQREHILRLAKVGELTVDATPKKHANAASAFLSEVEVHVLLEGVLDLAKEQAKAEKDIAELTKYMAGVDAKLGNEQFLAKAPANVVDDLRAKKAEVEDRLVKLRQRMEGMAK